MGPLVFVNEPISGKWPHLQKRYGATFDMLNMLWPKDQSIFEMAPFRVRNGAISSFKDHNILEVGPFRLEMGPFRLKWGHFGRPKRHNTRELGPNTRCFGPLRPTVYKAMSEEAESDAMFSCAAKHIL